MFEKPNFQSPTYSWVEQQDREFVHYGVHEQYISLCRGVGYEAGEMRIMPWAEDIDQVTCWNCKRLFYAFNDEPPVLYWP